MKYVLIGLLVVVLVYLQYTKGIMFYKHKIAVAFIGRRGKNSWTSSYTACTGMVRFGGVFEEGRYKFALDCKGDDGSVCVEIARRKEILAVLDEKHSQKTLDLPKGRYTVTTRYKKASGSLELRWDRL